MKPKAIKLQLWFPTYFSEVSGNVSLGLPLKSCTIHTLEHPRLSDHKSRRYAAEVCSNHLPSSNPLGSFFRHVIHHEAMLPVDLVAKCCQSNQHLRKASVMDIQDQKKCLAGRIIASPIAGFKVIISAQFRSKRRIGQQVSVDSLGKIHHGLV